MEFLGAAITENGACEEPISTFGESAFPINTVVIGRRTTAHRDQNNDHRLFDGLISGGKYCGGNLRIHNPQISVEIVDAPGTLILSHSSFLVHSVSQWSGQRYVVACYHQAASVQHLINKGLLSPPPPPTHVSKVPGAF